MLTAAAPRPLLTLERAATRIRDRKLLSDTFWTLFEGQSWAVVGPNGAGKSALAGLMLGTAPCVSGKVLRHVADARPGRIGHVSFELLEKLADQEVRLEEARHFSGRIDGGTTVRELIAAGAPHATDPQCPVAEAAERFGVSHLLDVDFIRLSSGELRRALIARALCRRPKILVLDEPFEGLDNDSRKRLQDAISAMIREGRSVVLVTHRLECLVPEISHALCVRGGRVVNQGPRAAVLNGDAVSRLYAPSAPPPPPRRRKAHPAGRQKPDEPPLIEMRQVRVVYGSKVVLDRLDWTVRRGEHWAVLGPNGAGKTTLLSLISGDHPQAYANRIFLFGTRRGTGESIWEIKRRISLVSSEFQRRYRKSIGALEVVLSGFFDSVGLYRHADDRQRAAAQRWLSFVGLPDKGGERFDRLSYGERRRVLLARCLVKNPDLLILDEPCQGLDPEMRRRFVALIEGLCSDSVPSLLYVTHHEDEIPGCIHRILRLEPETATASARGNDPPAGSCKSH
jgi:molybdate transport system ATP-binding protein